MPARTSNSLAVIGDPVAHSLSPVIHNAALKDLGLAYHYKRIHVKVGRLKTFMKGSARKLAGFNVTLPHKENIISYLDFVAPKAKLMGAVNTVLKHQRKLIGFNTDGDGYLLSLRQEKKIDPGSMTLTLLGAGGAARSIAVTLAFAKVRKITIANRSIQRAKKLCSLLSHHFPKISFVYCGLEGSVFKNALQKTNLLINTTSIGLGGTHFEEFPWDQVGPKAVVSDIVYTPRWTPFLKEAKKRGHTVHTGDGMLVHQGALSFELWTGYQPDVRVMRKALRAALQGL